MTTNILEAQARSIDELVSAKNAQQEVIVEQAKRIEELLAKNVMLMFEQQRAEKAEAALKECMAHADAMEDQLCDQGNGLLFPAQVAYREWRGN